MLGRVTTEPDTQSQLDSLATARLRRPIRADPRSSARDVSPRAWPPLSELLRQFYADVRRIASKRRRRLPPAASMHTSTVLQEAVLRLVRRRRAAWDDTVHFFADFKQAAAHVVIDYIRRKSAAKRDAPMVHGDTAVEAAGALVDGQTASPEQKLAVSQAIERLQREHPRAAQVVFLRFFCDLSAPRIAEAMSMSQRAVERDWAFARAWLATELQSA
jgi:RNA polymerase sigma factor (TIGR02999 family)